jgi:hypothetical protein
MADSWRSMTLTEEQHAAIGMIAVESAYLEDQIDWMIGHLTKLSSEQQGILISSAKLTNKIDVLRKLGNLRLKSQERKKQFKEILDNLAHQNTQRNIAIHGIWSFADPRITLASLASNQPLGPAFAKHGPKKENKLRADQLGAIAQKISEGNLKLRKFFLLVFVRPYWRASRSKAHPTVHK